jgi:sodium-dependent dicarboxylate transporter 2/3/5
MSPGKREIATNPDREPGGGVRSRVQWAGLAAGPLLALLVYSVLPESYLNSEGGTVVFSHAGRATASVGVWMAVWWMTEAIPVYATALLPLAALPLLGAVSMREAASPYGHELIFLFMGGFILALSMQRWGLHDRVALLALRLVGTKPRNMVGGFMIVTAVMSMWVSNTATTVIMLPIALSVIGLVRSRQGPGGGSAPASGGKAAEPGSRGPITEGTGRNFALCLLLGIAYAASIGGIGTLIGTPPNLFLASFIKSHLGREISFVKWMGIGLPLVVLFLPLTWLLLTRLLYPIRIGRIEGGGAYVREAYRRLGRMNRGEWATFIVFMLTAFTWIFRPLLVKIALAGVKPLAGLSDPGVVMLAALALFVIPVNVRGREFVMNWETAVKLPWGLLVLFGGGLSLAAAVQANGVGEFLGNQVSALQGVPPLLLVTLVAALMIFLTELTSNTASTATLVPIMYAVALGLGLHPYALIVPTAIAASCAFMLPVATPPNAIVFGSGYVSIPQMCRAGIWLNLIGIVMVTALTYLVALPLLGS